MIHIKRIPLLMLLLATAPFAGNVLAHGFAIEQNSIFNPTAFAISSEAAYLDNPQVTPGPSNLFLDEFNPNPNNIGPGLPISVDTLGNNPTNAASYGTFEGFVQQVAGPSGSWPIRSATFNVLSPLYYSDGTGSAACPATPGTYLQFYDAVDGEYAGASQLPSLGGPYINITGTTPFTPGFPVSAEDYHELQKDLYLAAGSAQTYGEYGYAFEVTVSLFSPFDPSDIVMLTSPIMVDEFAMTDPSLNPALDYPANPNGGIYGGDFGDFAPLAQQDAASMFIYDAAMSAAATVPEPSAFILAALSVGFCAVFCLRGRRDPQPARAPRS